MFKISFSNSVHSNLKQAGHSAKKFQLHSANGTTSTSGFQGTLPKSTNYQGSFGDKPAINEIPGSRWETGVPPVMGGHLMASGTVAPISTSTGEGDCAPHMFQYPAEDCDASVLKYPDSQAASRGLASLIADASAEAIARKGSFSIALSGGSLVKQLATLLDLSDVAWGSWHVFWADERNVPHNSPDSNYKGAMDSFLSNLPIPASQIHSIGEGLSAEQAATVYEADMLKLRGGVLPEKEGFPELDLVLLGVGPDGHVASLFPNHALLAPTSRWVLPITDSPKPPPERITLTLPTINAARQVVVVALGAGKAEVLQRVLEVTSLPGALPAQLVRPVGGELKWVVDEESSQQLSLDKWANFKAYPRNALPRKKAQ